MPTELRAFIKNCESAKNTLLTHGAKVLSHYAFKDYIYLNEASEDEYIRIRHYSKTTWKQKMINLTHKAFDSSISGMRKISYQEFDNFEDAKDAVLPTFKLINSYFRTGDELLRDHIKIYIEKIEGLAPSIEVIAESGEQINALFRLLNINDKDIADKSVPFLVCKVQLEL